MPYCRATGQPCTIKEVKPKSCIECVYIYYYGAKDTEDLHRKIVEMFQTKPKHYGLIMNQEGDLYSE